MSERVNDNRFSREQAQEYWRNPGDGINSPLEYLLDTPTLRLRNKSLISVFETHVSRTDRILELGCNAGRNLHALHDAGYYNLSAIEINADAIEVMQKFLPHISSDVDIQIGAIEDIIKNFRQNSFDIIFSMAVLVHLPDESMWILKEVAKKARKKIILFEHENPSETSERHFPRRYRPLLQSHKRPQVDHWWPVAGLPASYVCRVFGPNPETDGETVDV